MSRLSQATLVAFLALCGLQASPTMAQETQNQDRAAPMEGMMGMHDSAMQSAMERMQQNMMMPLSGNADIDFVRMMIPHHQGAIDMARIELEQGKDPVIRKLAEDVIAAQMQEIALMQAWLDQQPK